MPKTKTIIGDEIYIGIDPGKNGGLVAICFDYSKKPFVYLIDPMPDTELGIWKWFERLPHQVDDINVKALIEKVHSMPKQGVASSFTFGKGYGGLRMALIASSFSFQEITPQSWMKYLEVPKRQKTETSTQWKDRLRSLAQQLYPDLEIWNETLGKQRAVADALLIAEVCRRKNLGE